MSQPPQPVPSRRLSWLFLLVAVLVAAALFVITRVPAQDTQVEGIQSVSAETLARGATLFGETCAACHGASGEGHATALNAPALNGSEHTWHHSDEQIVGLIRQGGMQMPAVGADWSDADIEAVLAHVKAWWTPQQRETQPGTLGE